MMQMIIHQRAMGHGQQRTQQIMTQVMEVVMSHGFASSSTSYESDTGVAAATAVTGYYIPTDHLTETSASSAWAAGHWVKE